MGHGHRDAGDALLHAVGALGDGLDAVVQVVDLAAAAQLSADGVVQNPIVVLHDKGLDRIAVVGRLLDGGHIADAGQGHVERPRYGGG